MLTAVWHGECVAVCYKYYCITGNWIFSQCLNFLLYDLKRRVHNYVFYRVVGESKWEKAHEVLNKLPDTQEPIGIYLLLSLLSPRSLCSLSLSMCASLFHLLSGERWGLNSEMQKWKWVPSDLLKWPRQEKSWRVKLLWKLKPETTHVTTQRLPKNQEGKEKASLQKLLIDIKTRR